MNVHRYVAEARTLRERTLCQTEPDWNLQVTDDDDAVTCVDCIVALAELDR